MKNLSILAILFFMMITGCYAENNTLGYIEVPIHNKQGMFVVSAKINGISADLYLDTGSTSSVIEQTLLGKYSIKYEKHLIQNNGVVVGSDQVAYTPITIEQLSLGTVSLSKIPGVAMSLDDINQGRSNPIVGILGQDVLLSNKSLISFSKMSLLFPAATGKGKPVEIKNKHKIKLKRLNNGFFVVSASINSTRVNLLLDSGSPDIVLDTTSKFFLFDTGKKTLAKLKTAQRNGDENNIEYFNPQSVKIGKHLLKRSKLLSTDLSHLTKWLETQENIIIEGTLGLKALKDLGAVLDLSNAILYVQ